MFAIMGTLSFVGFIGMFQMKMLFNDSFSEKVRVCLRVRVCGLLVVQI